MKRILGLILTYLSLSQAFDTNVTRNVAVLTFLINLFSGQLDSSRGLYCGLDGAGDHCPDQPDRPQQDAGAHHRSKQEHYCKGKLSQEFN